MDDPEKVISASDVGIDKTRPDSDFDEPVVDGPSPAPGGLHRGLSARQIQMFVMLYLFSLESG
jgi:hypothetical protein